jgi:DNA repair protein RecN (Recombination protein N)
MISRFYLKEHLSFDEISCDFTNGLVIFSGPSGAGKSVLMNSIQTLFGNQDSKAKLAEMIIEDHGITSDIFGLELDDDIIIKQTSSTKTRFFLNNQSISKKDLSNFTSNFSKHLHLKDTSDFESDKIIDFLDTLISKKDSSFENLLNDFQGQFKDLKSKIEQLKQINADEKKS